MSFQTYPTGSAYIVDRKSAADIDLVILLENEVEAAMYKLKHTGQGWELCGNDYGMNGEFFALRKGDQNHIVVWDHAVFLRWVAFTELAKVLGLSAKVERVELAKAIIDRDDTAATNIVRTSTFYQHAQAVSDLYLSE